TTSLLPHTRPRGHEDCRCTPPAHTRTPAPARPADQASDRRGSCTEAAPAHRNNDHRQKPSSLIAKLLTCYPSPEGPSLHATFTVSAAATAGIPDRALCPGRRRRRGSGGSIPSRI